MSERHAQQNINNENVKHNSNQRYKRQTTASTASKVAATAAAAAATAPHHDCAIYSAAIHTETTIWHNTKVFTIRTPKCLAMFI